MRSHSRRAGGFSALLKSAYNSREVMKNKYVKPANLPRAAYNKPLGDVLEYYRRKADVKRTQPMRTILEIFEEKQVRYMMPESVFIVVSGAIEQAKFINSNTTLLYMMRQFPEDLKHKIKVTTFNHVAPDDTRFSVHADLVTNWAGKTYEL